MIKIEQQDTNLDEVEESELSLSRARTRGSRSIFSTASTFSLSGDRQPSSGDSAASFVACVSAASIGEGAELEPSTIEVESDIRS